MHPSIRAEIMLLSNSFTQSQKHIRYYSTTPFKNSVKIPIKFQPSFCIPWTKDHANKTRSIIYSIRRIKGILQRFVHIWRFKRLILRNTEDSVTLDPIQNPVQIVDWNGRQIFQFEANSLMKDITERLLNHDGVYDYPQMPRNAFTNEPLTQAQMISVWSQLSRTTVASSWAFTAFRAARWDIDTYQDEYAVPIRLDSLRKTLKSIDHRDTQEMVKDFIMEAYTYFKFEYPENRFDYMMDKHLHSSIINSWRVLTLAYNEICITFLNNPGRLFLEKQRIMRKAGLLIQKNI